MEGRGTFKHLFTESCKMHNNLRKYKFKIKSPL